MAGISYLRPQYNNLGSPVTRLAGSARQVAHEKDLAEIASLAEGRNAGGSEEPLLQEVVPRLSDEQHGADSGRKESQQQTPADVAAPPAGGNFRVDPHLPPTERMTAAGLLVEQLAPMSERLRVAEQAYSASRNILKGILVRPGNGFDTAS